jgi:hypothetical protein
MTLLNLYLRWSYSYSKVFNFLWHSKDIQSCCILKYVWKCSYKFRNSDTWNTRLEAFTARISDAVSGQLCQPSPMFRRLCVSAISVRFRNVVLLFQLMSPSLGYDEKYASETSFFCSVSYLCQWIVCLRNVVLMVRLISLSVGYSAKSVSETSYFCSISYFCQ